MIQLSRFRLPAALLLLCAAAPPATAQFSWPSEAERVKGWRADLDSSLTAFLPVDRSFSSDARAKFIRDIYDLRRAVPRLTDEQITVKLATAVAGAHNAHTRLYLLRNRTSLRRYPIRVWWFGKDLCVVRTHTELADLLGARILKIAVVPVAEAAARVGPLYPANDSWARYMSTYLLTSPEILKGVGILAATDTLDLTIQTRDHHTRTVRIAPMPFERSDQPTEAWWDLAPTHPGRQGPWISCLHGDSARLPLYIRHPTANYWMQRVDGGRLLYVNYNRAQDQADGEGVLAFGDRVIQEIRRTPPKKLIVDLRFNTGGNLQLADSLFRSIAALPLSQEPNRLFVITGRATFSAGITAVATLRQFTKAVIVGEPVGDGLDMWSEGGNLLLPNTHLTLHYANGFHSYTPIEHPEFKPYNYPDLSVTEVGPDIKVETTLEQYLAGKDPAMDAILTAKP